ncbi:MAG: AI-2E family transporter [Blastocatellia bacterium]|nr:AI-2E family transporter [Blastocatellia bacterium]
MHSSNRPHHEAQAAQQPVAPLHPPSAWWVRLLWPRWLPLLVATTMVLLFGKVLVSVLPGVSEVFKPVFVPFILSLALAYLIKPLVVWCEKHRLSRQWSVLVAMTLATIGFLVLLLIFIPIGAQLSQVTAQVPGTAQKFSAWLRPNLETLHQKYPAAYEKVAEKVMERLQNPSGLIEPVLEEFGSISASLVSVLGSVLNLILIPFFVYYILKDAKPASDKFIGLIPPRHQESARHLLGQVDSVLSNYVRGQLIVCSCMAVLYTIAFWLLGVPLALPLGILSGFGHLVPYVGTLSAAVLTLILTLFDQPTLWQVLLVIATYPVVQSTEGFVLTPLILGERLELHPFIVIVGLLLAHHLFGILGIMLAVPVLASCKVILEFVAEKYEQSDFYRFLPSIPSPPAPMTASQPTSPQMAEELGIEN